MTATASTATRGRYAPSPTGRLHLGNARTALLAWLDVRRRRGAFVLRVEDNDPGRSRRALEDQMLRDLAWLGLDWDEGPDVGGPFGPYRQSERDDHYAAALARLATYPCTCTRRELRALPTMGATGEPVYPGTCRPGAGTCRPGAGTCRPGAGTFRAGVVAGRPAAIRWRVPPGVVAFTDRLLGPHTQTVDREVGDFVLRRGDGAWAYQLAVVVDDAAMQIDTIVRGADLLDSTPRQILLQRALGLPTPTYAHVPLILGASGAKLSKRDGAPDLGELRESGADPAVVVATLARSVGLVGPDVTSVTPAALVRDFDLGAVQSLPCDPASLV